MSEFVLDHGTREASEKFRALDSFTQGYVEAIFFTSTGLGYDADANMAHATLAELSSEALAMIIEDCAAFQAKSAKSLAIAYDYAPGNYDAERAGIDFWYTRNGYGTGFWDRGFGGIGSTMVGDMLTADAELYGDRSLYRGDDGLLYLS